MVPEGIRHEKLNLTQGAAQANQEVKAGIHVMTGLR
jgi:hypothetical protein